MRWAIGVRLSIIYNIGFVTARTIAEADGTQELAAYLKKPGYGFLRSYTQPPAYGTDPTWSEHIGVGEAPLKGMSEPGLIRPLVLE
ncbi:hypothetical protein [Sphingomonas sp. Leaf28]|uniref:hypothetical protein n=1 Tax=Sphingomonas sp. Leaf28 TaxID=1735695 RepID=UPI0012E2F0E0|nr:hypothetical protein [Sphingomonas sp. Leaf28]